MNYFEHCREFTLESSTQKLLPANRLEDFWGYNYRSFLNYMEQVLYGVRGVVTNSANNEAVSAQVFIENHDKEETQVYSALPRGNYFRPIKEGTYDITFSAAGFHSKTISDVGVFVTEVLVLNVELEPIEILSADFYANDSIIGVGTEINFFDASYGGDVVSWEWEFEGGNPATSDAQNPANILYSETGFYNVTLKISDLEGETDTKTMEQYIRVSEIFTMKDTTIYLYEGIFFDSGGEDDYYQNDEDYTITFISVLEAKNMSGALKATFRVFDVEEDANCQYDYLEAFDGPDTDSPLIGTWCGNELPGTMITTNIEGALTFRFHSNSSINRPGWKAEITSDISLDIPDNALVGFEIFPNPAKEKVTVKLKVPNGILSIYNLSGKQLNEFEISGYKHEIDISDLKSGIYFLKVFQQDRIFTKRLVIN